MVPKGLGMSGLALLVCLPGMVTLASTTPKLPAIDTTTNQPSMVTSGTADDCIDDVNEDCWRRPDMDCFGIYEPWSRVHCPLRCGFCPGKEPPCEDKGEHCHQYDDEACTGEQYQVWARSQCRKRCNLCTVPTPPQAGSTDTTHWTKDTPADGEVRYACAGGAITLPWNYMLSTGVIEGDIQWFYEGPTRQMIAITTHGHFLPLPGFSHRVIPLGKAGLTISHMTVADSGNYTVEVHLYDAANSGTHTVLSRTVFVQISDDLMTQDGYLHVTQRQEAVLDPESEDWSIELQCGTFTFRGDPAFQVEWITPSGQNTSSSGYNDNHFNLLLTNPVEGGNYSCRIPAQQAANTCLNGNGAHKGEATLYVDKMDARFTLLEKENQELKMSNTHLKQRLDSVEQKSSNMAGMESRLHNLEESSTKRVAFHATGIKVPLTTTTTATTTTTTAATTSSTTSTSPTTSSRTITTSTTPTATMFTTTTTMTSPIPSTTTPIPLHNTTIIINTTIHYNLGDGYDASSGIFTAPVSGSYFFIAALKMNTPGGVGVTGTFSLMTGHHSVLSSAEMFGYTVYHSMASLHGAVGLSKGETVWLTGRMDDRYVDHDMASFTGFLVSPDNV